MRIFCCIYISLYLFSCRTAKLPNYDSKPGQKQVFIVYDQEIWSWPAKNSTEIIIPGIYLPLQKKAFKLDRYVNSKRRVLQLVFSQQDDSSTIQIIANRFSYKNCIYTDTFLKVKELPEPIYCFRLHISTYKTKKHGFVPVFGVVAFDCKGTESLLNARSSWLYHIPDNKMMGRDPSIYVKKGYFHLFRKPFIPANPIIRVSDLVD